MADCFFCGAYVGEETGDGGCKGRTVGNKDICEQCLAELKHWLNGTIPRAPSMREKKIDEDEVSDDEVSVESDNSDDPFSASPKV